MKRAEAAQTLHDAVRALLPEDLLPRVRAVHAENDTLVVVCDSPAWATRLRFLMPRLLEQLTARGDLTIPQRVSVVVRVPPVEKPAPTPQRPWAPSAAAADALVDGAASFAPDDPLRRTLERLAARARRRDPD